MKLFLMFFFKKISVELSPFNSVCGAFGRVDVHLWSLSLGLIRFLKQGCSYLYFLPFRRLHFILRSLF